MKRICFVLLVLVLISGFAFASFSGDATISFDYDLDTDDNGIINSTSMLYDFNFKLDNAEASSTGEGTIFAEIAATASLSIDAYEKGTNTVDCKASLEVTKAIVSAYGVTINILGPKGAFDFAKGYWTNVFGEYLPNEVSAYRITDHGLVVSYSNVDVAFSYYHTGAKHKDAVVNYAVNPATGVIEDMGSPAVDLPARTNLYLGAQVKSIALAEGLSLNTGANYKLERDCTEDVSLMQISGGAKIAFSNTDEKISADLAMDFGYDTLYTGDPNQGLYIGEISAMAKYDFVKLNIYYGAANMNELADANLMTKLSASYKANDRITVGGSGEILWWQVGNAERKPNFSVGVDFSYTDDKFKATVSVDAFIKYNYTTESYELSPDAFEFRHMKGLAVNAKISTNALIDNTTVALEYKDSDLSPSGDGVHALGCISASVKVSF